MSRRLLADAFLAETGEIVAVVGQNPLARYGLHQMLARQLLNSLLTARHIVSGIQSKWLQYEQKPVI